MLDVQLNASWGTEATSLSLLEGMSIGLPAMSAITAVTRMSSKTKETVLSFRTKDSAALADATAVF
jgi:hypothetical protein